MKLTTKGIERLRAGRHGDGGGLYLVIEKPPSQSRHWVLRVTISGTRRDLGLGACPVVSLAKARRRAFTTRVAIADGIDPLAEKRRATVPTFADAAEQVIAFHQDTWKGGGKTAALWRTTLAEYVYPHFGTTGVDTVGTADVMNALTPIWAGKHATAVKVRRRIGAIMKWAIAQGYRQDDPAGAAVTAALPKRTAPVKHMTAIPHAAVADAIARVHASGAWIGTQLAFEFLVLTATRSGEVRNADWSEIDLDHRVWTIPAARAKTARAHRVPLPDRAVAILLEAITLGDGAGLLFPSVRGRAISDMTISKLIRERGIAAVPHGFRSSFRDWASELTDHPREVVEAALAHVRGDQTEAAYARSDLFDRRRRLMADWACYLSNTV